MLEFWLHQTIASFAVLFVQRNFASACSRQDLLQCSDRCSPVLDYQRPAHIVQAGPDQTEWLDLVHALCTV